MANEAARYRTLYAKLLRFYPKLFRERFGEGMEQTFNDLCRERSEAGLFRVALWAFADTLAGILRENMMSMVMQNKRVVRVVLGTGLILLIPLVMTLLGDGVEGEGWRWKFGDFVVMGIILFTAGLALDIVTRKLSRPVYRVIACTAILSALTITWAELAVGVLGTPFAGS